VDANIDDIHVTVDDGKETDLDALSADLDKLTQQTGVILASGKESVVVPPVSVHSDDSDSESDSDIDDEYGIGMRSFNNHFHLSHEDHSKVDDVESDNDASLAKKSDTVDGEPNFNHTIPPSITITQDEDDEKEDTQPTPVQQSTPVEEDEEYELSYNPYSEFLSSSSESSSSDSDSETDEELEEEEEKQKQELISYFKDRYEIVKGLQIIKDYLKRTEVS
jgi:hypothetical protein